MRKSKTIPGRRTTPCPLLAQKFSLIQPYSALFRNVQVKPDEGKALMEGGLGHARGQESTGNQLTSFAQPMTNDRQPKINWQHRKHGNIFGSKPETGNKVPSQVLATQQCNLLLETKKFMPHALTGHSGHCSARSAWFGMGDIAMMFPCGLFPQFCASMKPGFADLRPLKLWPAPFRCQRRAICLGSIKDLCLDLNQFGAKERHCKMEQDDERRIHESKSRRGGDHF